MAWLAMKDGPPPEPEEYICATSTGLVTALYWSGSSWNGCNDIDDYWDRFVTHWMPLPIHPEK